MRSPLEAVKPEPVLRYPVGVFDEAPGPPKRLAGVLSGEEPNRGGSP